ncbi:MAG: site-specific integrase [Treponema sp.]|nr:site-specific integrase [Treponema sp.]
MKRHLYKRKIKETKSGKPVRAWYFWYLDPITKKKVRKSCGTSKNPIYARDEADKVIESLEMQDREYLAIRADKESITIEKMAANMFYEGSTYVKSRRENGYIKDETTLKEIQGHLKNFIVKYYGHLKPEEIDPVVIDHDLINMERSNSWRNRMVSILNFILDEAVWLKMIRYKPILKTYKVPKGKKDILTREEMNRLFPDDFDELSKIWGRGGAVSSDGFMFGVLFALKASTGLRGGEVRAISPSQIIATNGKNIAKVVGENGKEIVKPLGDIKRKIIFGLVIDQMINTAGKIVNHLKKGDEADPKFRVAVIPEKTVRYLKQWLAVRSVNESRDLLFTYKGLRIRREYLLDRFAIGLKNAEINMANNRKLTPHSLRFTYNTKMRRRISDDKLRAMMGHDSKSMTDYYTIMNIAELEEQFLGLRDNSGAIDNFWN